MKKQGLVLLALAFVHVSSWACTVCQKQQPKVLRGITHGAGPEGAWDYVIIGVMVLIVVISFFYSIKWIVRPGEKNPDHIKQSIFNMEQQS